MDEKKKCPKCGGNIIMVEYHGLEKYHYDGVSEYNCVNALRYEDGVEPTCDWRVGRWCGRKLEKGEVEPPFCEGKKHPKVIWKKK
jgi:hypothetical protein